MKFILLHVLFISKSVSENRIKIHWFLTQKLKTKISWLLFYGPQCIYVICLYCRWVVRVQTAVWTRTLCRFLARRSIQTFSPVCWIAVLFYTVLLHSWTFCSDWSLHCLIWVRPWPVMSVRWNTNVTQLWVNGKDAGVVKMYQCLA